MTFSRQTTTSARFPRTPSWTPSPRAACPRAGVATMRQQTRDALVATTDAGIFPVACALSGSLCDLIHDDALLDVRRSLMRP